jgi:Protein of unknown function (DUF2971)
MASKHSVEMQEQLGREIISAMKRYAVDETPPHPAYHFTTLAGMRGILESRSFWVTLATAAKDSSEIAYALSRARQLLSRPAPTPDPSFWSEVSELLNVENSALVSMLGWNTYLLSFRTNADGSGHWKEYGDSGKGAALAFGMKPLAVPGLLFLPVIYDPAQQDRLIGEFVEAVATQVTRLSKHWPFNQFVALRRLSIHLAALGLWTLAPLMKAPKFSDEQEWRLIVADAEHAEVRHEKNLSLETFHRQFEGRDIPYRVLRYDALPLLGIELGANAPIATDDSTLVQLVREAAIPSIPVPISRSRVTLKDA